MLRGKEDVKGHGNCRGVERRGKRLVLTEFLEAERKWAKRMMKGKRERRGKLAQEKIKADYIPLLPQI